MSGPGTNTMSDSDELRRLIRTELSDGPAEQDWLIGILICRYGYDRTEVLGELRQLMIDDKISYDIDWLIQLEN